MLIYFSLFRMYFFVLYFLIFLMFFFLFFLFFFSRLVYFVLLKKQVLNEAKVLTLKLILQSELYAKPTLTKNSKTPLWCLFLSFLTQGGFSSLSIAFAFHFSEFFVVNFFYGKHGSFERAFFTQVFFTFRANCKSL